MNANDTSYEIGDHFLCVDMQMGYEPKYAFVGKIVYIKKRKDGCHRYHYKTVVKWGEGSLIIDNEGELVPGGWHFICSRKINHSEVQFCRMLWNDFI